MRTGKAFFTAAAIVAALSLAGCVVQQYRNPGACEQAMHERLAEVSHAKLSVTHTAVSYQGRRVVIEGQLGSATPTAAKASAPQAASQAAASASAAASAVVASGVKGADGVSRAADTKAASTTDAANANATDTTNSDSLDAALAAASTTPPRAPTTLMGMLFARLSSSPKPRTMATAAECTFNKAGLATFRWLAPAQLARTTPDMQDDDQPPGSGSH